MEPPSSELIKGVEALGIANERDFQSCRARVRRLAQGLPAFDSVWLDALVHKKILTPFQAQYFEEKRSEQLQVSDSLVLEGQLHFDPIMSMFVASDSKSKRQYFVGRCQLVDPHVFDVHEDPISQNKQVPSGRQDANSILESSGVSKVAELLKRTSLEQSEEFRERFFLDREQKALFHFQPFQAGLSLQQFLIRRGRFPEDIVRYIAVEVCEQLKGSKFGAVHGDLRLANIWLTNDGGLILLNHGLLNTAFPHPTIHTKLPMDSYDSLAPERIDSSFPTPANLSAEMYSLGCLLWNLLTGRPPFPLADPLAKIAAHRQIQLPDIRELAPDVSESLAELISRLMHKQPSKRPKSWDDVQGTIGRGSAQGVSRLKGFVQSFESAAPRSLGEKRVKVRQFPKKMALALCFTILAAGFFWNRDRLHLPALTRAAASVEAISPDEFKPVVFSDSEETSQIGELNSTQALPDDTRVHEPANEESALLEFPSPDQNGFVLLAEEGPYRMSSLSAGDRLILQGAQGVQPIVLVENNEAVFEGKTVSLENVLLQFIENKGNPPSSSSSIKIVADEFRMTRCVVSTESNHRSESLIQWDGQSSVTTNSGRLLVSNSIVTSSRPVIEVNTPLTTALIENVMKRELGSLLLLNGGVHAGLRVPVVLNRCSFVHPESLIHIQNVEKMPDSGLLSIQGEQTLLSASTEKPVIGLTGNSLPEKWSQHVEIAAQGLFVSEAALLFGYRDSAEAGWSRTDTVNVKIDGLLSGQFHFQKKPGSANENDPLEQVIIDSLPVRLSKDVPGFNFVQYQASFE